MMGDGWSLMPDVAIKMGPDFLAYKSAYTDAAGYRGGPLLTDHATDKKTVTFKGSSHIPLMIGSRWFFCDADQNIVIPTALDDYLADAVVEDGTGTWTASANVTASTDTGQVKLAIAAGFTTGLVGYRDISAVDMSLTGKNAISFLIKSSILLRHGDLQLILDEHSACASADETLTIPGLAAGVQTRVILSFASAAAARNAIISICLNATRDFGAADIWIDDIKTTTIEAGKDYCVYACDNSGTLVFKVSKNTTYPAGFTADTSRKIGGFHTLCLAAGTISGHSLTTYDTADIIPYSIWDLKHRPRSAPAGMAFSPQISKWVDIYLVSGTGANSASINGGTISDTRDWNDFVDDAGAVLKRLLTDSEFQIAAEGSNQKTNINGSADAVTTGGGHIDTAGRRMVSNIGCEDCCGVMWQWLDTQNYRYDPNGTSVAATQTSAVTHVASPGGNPVYLKYGTDGDAYLCCNMATDAVDKFLAFGTAYKVIIKHDASASGGLQVYFDDDGTAPNRLLVNNTLNGGKDVYIMSNNADFWLPVVHNANAATTGVAISYDDGADERLEGTLPGAANANLDLSVGTSFGYKTLGGNKGSLYGQGAQYGDVKLLAGGHWSSGTSAGSRARFANYYRWDTNTGIGSRFASEPL
jgi:hypothetical protein